MWKNERVRRTLTVGIVVALAGVVAAGCGDDEQAPPTTGAIGVTTVTTGDNPDADGYALTIDGNAAGNIGINDQTVIADQAPGIYQVELTDVAANCTVAGDNPRAVDVTAGLTEGTTFNVDCPGAPAASALTVSTTADTVALDWTESALATSYRAELVGGTADLSKTVAAGELAATFTDADDGLEDGVTYEATVYAVNDQGETASNMEEVDTNFFPWDENFPMSLHETGQGKMTYYNADPNGGFETATGVPYQNTDCVGCHSAASGLPPVSGRTCDRCHDTADPQLGDQSVDASWDPATSVCLGCHSRQGAEMSLGFTDVHRDMGFGCMDCHTKGDVMGDGNTYLSYQDIGAIDSQCTDCHDASTHSAASNPHGDAVSCAACHAQTVVTCNNCHFEAELNGQGKIFYGPPPTSNWMWLGNRPKRDGSGETEVYPVNYQSVEYQNSTIVAFGHFTPHSIANPGRDCTDCHNNFGGTNAAIEQYNTDGFIDVAKWDAGTSTLSFPTGGVIPLPEDYLTSLKFDFVTTADLGTTWTFLKAGADTIQVLTDYVTPLSAAQMSNLGMVAP